MKTKTLTTQIKSLTLALTLAPLGLALGAVGVVAPGVASAASCTPVMNAPMASWVWTGQALYVVPEGESGSNAINVPMPSGITYPSAWLNQPLDNPAPLEWLYANGPKYGIPTSNLADLFGACTSYTPALISTMNSEHFSPSVIGGVNPPGVVTATSTPTTTQPTSSSQPSTQPTTKPTTPSGVTPTSGGSTSTSSTSPSPTQPAVLPVSAPSPTVWQRYLTVLKSDQSIVTADQSPPSPPPTGSPVWPYVLGGAVVVAGVVATLIRRRTPKSLDEINQDWGGHRGGR